jgi:uncharacterized protein DUF6599
VLRRVATESDLLVSNRLTGMNRYSRFALYCMAAALGAVTPAAFAQQQPQVLPKQFGNWKDGGSGPPAATKHYYTDTAVLRESACSSVEDSWYVNGAKWIYVVEQEFRDTSGSYEAYTSQLNPGLNPSTVAPLTAAGNDQILALVGNRLVTISGIRSASDADLKLLLDSVRQNADRTPLPPIRAYLPEQRLVQGTQRYALGPAGFNAALDALNESKFAAVTPEIGFSSGAEAMLASYQTERNRPQDLLIIDYPTPQLAEQRLHHIQAVISTNPALADVTVERKTSLLSLVLSPASPQAAAKLRGEIQYQMQVTWNEPSQTLTDPPWVVVLKNIFVGTLAFCGFAIVMGIAFGGVRVVTKKLFPGKVFDRPEDIEVLQLGLSGKRIDPRDFY